MPLAKTLTINPEYKSLAELNDWQEDTHLHVYELTYFTPEMIWEYGKPIEVLKKDTYFKMPEEKVFGVLVAETDKDFFQKKFKDFSVEKITRYDMNPKGSESSSHRSRLYRDLYVVKKK